LPVLLERRVLEVLRLNPCSQLLAIDHDLYPLRRRICS
jgi:hypothetical protein